MKKFLRRVSAVVTALAVVAATVVFDMPGKIITEAADSHTHAVCAGTECTDPDHGSHEEIEWTAWSSANLPTTAGNYYLTKNLTLSSAVTVSSNITLCLNGYTITGKVNSIEVTNGGTLTVCDCIGSGQLTGFTTNVFVVSGGTLNLYNGSISDNTVSDANGAVYFYKGKFNMYGGTISDNTKTYGVSMNHKFNQSYDRTFVMYGGTISGNKNGVYVYERAAIFEMYGGTISDSKVAANGCGVWVGNGAKFNMHGGKITENKPNGSHSGGGVYVTDSLDRGTVFNMDGGEITNNTANSGGGVAVNDGTFNFSGGTISGNTTTTTGGGVGVYDKGTFNMAGGTISNNISGSNGGGVYNNGTTTISGGEIINNTAGSAGGGIFNFTKTLTLDGKITITGNTEGKEDAEKTNSDLKLGYKDRQVILGDNFCKESNIGVRYSDTIECRNSNYNKYYMTAEYMGGDVSDAFFADLENENVAWEDNKLRIYKEHVVPDTYDYTSSTGHGKKCEVCGGTIGFENHIFDDGKVTTAATCTDTGVKTFTCTVCGYNEKTETVAATGHSYKTTWSKDGTNHWHECSVCGDKKDSTAHTWNSGTVTTPASCTATGTKTYTCTVCSATKTEEIKATGHSATKTAAKAATCTADGNKEYWYCSNCKKYFSNSTCTTETTLTATVINKTGHSYSNAWTTSATNHWHVCANGCDTKGNNAAHSFTQKSDGTNHWQECTTCGYIKGSTAHTFEQQHDNTNHWQECTECNYKKDPTNHTLTEKSDDDCRWQGCACGYITGSTDHTFALRYNDGTKHWYECETCHYKKSETPHTLTTKKDASEHWKECSCGYKEGVTAHAWGDWALTVEPTVKNTGTAERTCSCGEKQTRSDIPKLTDPSWTKTETEKPTIDTDGKYTYTSDFGTVTAPVPKLTDSSWTKTETKKPTVDENGEYTYKSEYGTVTVTVPMLTNSPWEKEETKKPTIDTDGEYTYTSGYGDITAPVPKLTDSSWTKTETQKPTLNENGEYTYENNKFGEVKETVPKLSDTSVWTKDTSKHVDPTEEKDGKDVYTSDYGTVEVTLEQLEHIHDWGDWSITTAPTIATNGTATRVCKKFSSHTETATVPKLADSDWTKTETKKPTVKDNGSYTYTSTEHGTITVTVPKLTDPSWTKTETKKPTVNENGEYTYTSDYGEVKVTVPKLTDPSWTKTETKKPTEDENGEYTYESSYGKETVEIPKLSDTSVWTKDDTKHVEPTDDEDGKDVYKSAYGEVEIILPATGSISKQVQSGENAPAAKLPASGSMLAEAVLTEEDKLSVENDGAQIKILLIVDDATNSVSAADKAAVETAIGGLTNYKPGQYLDVNLFKVIDGVQNPITETKAALTITFEVPAALRGNSRTYSVIRVHNGETTVLNDLDSDPKTVTIKTDKFSTYVLAYSEKASAASSGVGNHTPSGNTPSGSSGASHNAATSSKKAPANNYGNPSTGIAVSLVPLAAALAAVALTFKRKKK